MILVVLAHRPMISLAQSLSARPEGEGGGARKGEKRNWITEGEKASRRVRDTKLFGVKDTRDSRKVSNSLFITERETKAQSRSKAKVSQQQQC